ncbi:tetratricopeptide repeat protein [Argonema galeatum]|uniref:tetratricopeptide repeat protein n=1 Tax=Argonema galeatum TaxID=2942762 RepID=UPI002013B4F6|nr:tetratricopeptide repeat protein [Argonema galeatum]MCL1467182.1 tetratricopeptide repeat protein [Argonema galeatum A003/A1]
MIQVAIFVCVGWLFSVCLHEFGHAIVAYWGGDTSVKDKGYLTLNPLKYTDFNLSLVLPLIFLLLGGIPLPGAAVYIDQRRLRSRWWKSAVSAAGPFASILVAVLLTITFRFGSPLPLGEYRWIWPALAFLTYLEIYVVILNLLPIPGLDGYGIIDPWLPPEIQERSRKFGQYGIVILFILLWFVEPLNRLLGDAAFYISQMVGIPLGMVGLGYVLFNEWAKVLLVVAIAIAFAVRQVTRKPHEVWYERGNGNIKGRKYEEAIAAFDQAIRVKSDFHEAWYMRGYALLQLQRYEDAIAAYDKAIEIKSDYWEAWHDRGIVLEVLQRYEDAIASYQKAVEIKPDFHLAWGKLGKMLNNLERYEEALSAYDKAIEIQPYDASIWTDRGVALGYLKRYDDAIASCEKAIKIDPRYFYAWYNKAGCYAEQGKVDLAIEDLKQAVKIDAGKLKDCAKTDKSFDSIRDRPAFRELMGE